MANIDDPRGFRFYKTLSGAPPTMDEVTLAGTVAQGDTLVDASGTATIGLSNSGQIFGVAAEAGVSGDVILFYPITTDVCFKAQCSGTYTKASHLYAAVDIEGTTGIQEVNEDATTEKVFQIQGLVEDGTNAVGANAVVWGQFRLGMFQDLEDAET